MPAEWTTPITWNVDQLVTNSDLNAQVRDNLEYLLSPNHERLLINEGPYSLNNVQTFQDIDSSELSIALDTHGGPVWLHFQGVAYTPDPNDILYFDFTVDGTRVGDGFHAGLAMVNSASTSYRVPLSIQVLLTGLAAGTYTLRPQWRTNAGGAGTLMNASASTAIIFEAIEL